MPNRRSHTKSRKGCLACKRRHLKCDEKGPPCSHCVSKRSECIFPASTEERRATSQDDNSTPSQTSPTPLPAPASPTRILELELMHRWSTSTAKSLCSLDVELYMMQVIVPEEGLKHEFLLNAMFAFAALDIATNTKQSEAAHYIRVALEYHNNSLGMFRTELANLNPQNHLAVLSYSSLTITIGMVLAQCAPNGNTTLESMILLFLDLWQGAESIASMNNDWWPKDAYGDALRDLVKQLEADPGTSPPEDIVEAITRLNAINDGAYDEASAKSRTAQWKAMSSHSACRKAIFQLEECFTKVSDPSKKAIVLAWPTLAGPEYAMAIKESDLLALFVFMHWGVMIDMNTDGIWWAMSTGKKLVDEISMMVPEDATLLWKEGVAWARQRVGLPKRVWEPQISP